MAFLDIFNFNKLPFPNEIGKMTYLRTKEIELNNALVIAVERDDSDFTKVSFACYSEGADILANYIQTATVGLGGVDITMLDQSDHLATGYKVTINRDSANAALCESIVATILNTRFQSVSQVFNVKLTTNETRIWLADRLNAGNNHSLEVDTKGNTPINFTMVHYRHINGSINVSYKTATIAFESVLEHVKLFTSSSVHVPGISHVTTFGQNGLTLYTFE